MDGAVARSRRIRWERGLVSYEWVEGRGHRVDGKNSEGLSANEKCCVSGKNQKRLRRNERAEVVLTEGVIRRVFDRRRGLGNSIANRGRCCKNRDRVL